jgi:radical SAM protein with 4Fe4S-binding SPASM domain
MDESLMFRVIDQATDISGVSAVGFSGGEPFLYYDLLKKGMDYAKEKGLGVTVATNGFWGIWEDDLLEKRIKNLPVDHISFSYDSYHSEFVSEEALSRAITLCKDLGIPYSVGIGETKERKANDFLTSLGSEKYLMDFYIFPYLKAGRAETEIPDDAFYRFLDTEKIRCRDEGLLAVRYDGEVFPCCVQTVFDTALSIGNIKNNSLKEITENSRLSKLLTIMKNSEAFTQLKDKAASELGMEFPEKCTEHCEICRLMFRKDEDLEKLLPYAEAIYDKLIVDRFLNKKGG